ncbi:GcrA cell cycle regulator [Roseibium sp. TrichSKD4]|uniref:GcrA family cell cycle regulator n=1 Tax=Roseibium sp. TrichSKD4 TaxID=744980 RepID=UPI0001E56717|nr:GcrA family cell cycle regulator [Roseibium sp. TrichSKD4]EFO34328.1 GcrA cell cycle regulator [Roseibium sp. TrichSKD4]
MSWTTERVELLKKLWSEGHSASQIAGELGGVTRNAVIGKVHRLGLSGRAKTTTTTSKAKRPRAATATAAPPKAKAPTKSPQPVSQGATALKMEEDVAPVAVPQANPEPIAELVPISERASILTLTERTCKWPIGDPSTDDFYFCGRQSDAGVPYCAHHCKVAYQPVSDRRRDRRPQVRAAS